MAADQPDRLAVQEYADQFYRPDHIPYVSFAGLVQGIVEDDSMTADAQVAEVRLALAALDLMLAEGGEPFEIVPGGPLKPPYGSEQAS